MLVQAERGCVGLGTFVPKPRARLENFVIHAPEIFGSWSLRSVLALLIFWCRRRDSNSQGLLHTDLNRACLPISPRLLTGFILEDLAKKKRAFRRLGA